MNRNPRSTIHERARQAGAALIGELHNQIERLERRVAAQATQITHYINANNSLHVELARERGVYERKEVGR